MNRRWIAVAIIVVAIIGIANAIILLVVMPGRSKAADNPPAAAAPVAAQNAASAPSSGAPPASAVAAAPATNPAPGAVQPVAPAPHHPSPPPIQPGMHVDRQVLTASGHLRILYLRDRQRGIREIAFQDAQNPSNQTVLADYKRNGWVVVSPNDDWVIFETRDQGESGIQLYHRVSNSPLKYEVPQELQAGGSGLRDVIWQSYLSDTQQDPNIDPRRVTIDATSWEPDSQRITLSVSPVPTKDNSTPPIAWTCLYNVNSQAIEPAGGEVAEGPGEQAQNGPNEMGNGAPNEMAAAPEEANSAPAAPENEQAEAGAPNDQAQELEGEKFPATREQEITVADANELELADVKYAIFEMFARHGAEMHDTQMRKAFSQFPWYQPRPGVSFDEVEQEFSEIEKHNVAVLRRVRDAKIAATHHSEPRHPIRGEPVQQESDGEKFMRGVIQGVSDALGGGGG